MYYMKYCRYLNTNFWTLLDQAVSVSSVLQRRITSIYISSISQHTSLGTIHDKTSFESHFQVSVESADLNLMLPRLISN